MKFKAISGVLLGAALGFFSSQACAGKALVGIAFPNQDNARWFSEGPVLMDTLKQAGFDVTLFYGGDDDVPIQQRQMPRMVEKEKVDILVVTPIDGKALTDALKAAKEKHIPVISYDRLIMNTDAVSYYVTFDNVRAGQMHAEAVIKELDLDNRAEPANIEFFGGSPTDNNAKVLWKAMISKLQPYIDSGKLSVPSKEMTFDKCATEFWNAENALKRMDSLIEKYHYAPKGGTKLDAVIAPSDGVANGIVAGLLKAGYDASTMPVITGQDAKKEAVKRIKDGLQTMTVLKRSTKLAAKVVDMCNAIVAGKEPELNNTTDYDNGTGPVKAYLCEPVYVDRSNYKELLVDTGMIKAEDLN